MSARFFSGSGSERIKAQVYAHVTFNVGAIIKSGSPVSLYALLFVGIVKWKPDFLQWFTPLIPEGPYKVELQALLRSMGSLVSRPWQLKWRDGLK